MSIRISRTEIESFVGDVAPLWLVSEENLKFARIVWSSTGDAVKVKKFSGCYHGAFGYGVLLTFMEPGEAVVTATCRDETYTCLVRSKARRDYSGEKMNFYKGDLHSHTSKEHVHDKFIARTEALYPDYLEYIKKENLRDLAVITDHSETIDHENFFRGFTAYDEMREDMEPIVYPGCESEIQYVEPDRFGRLHRRSGELITLNANNFSQSNTYEEFLTAYTDSPFVIGIFPHPHIIGVSTKGVWDYRPRLNNSKAMRDLIKYVEVLGNPRKENMLHEYVYSEALDGGYRVSTTCSSDFHSAWDFNAYPGATVIMAPEKTREAFTDSLLNLRAYACESGNIKLTYSVNGLTAPCDLPLADKYHFKVEIDYFEENKSTRPVRCDVISDGGVTVKSFEDVNFESFEFDVESSTARWFYLRFVDSNTKRTFSCPVFTGREVIPYKIDDLVPIDYKTLKITDADGSDASALVDGDTLTVWRGTAPRCSLTIDMGCVRKVSALGNYGVSIVPPPSTPETVGRVQGELEAGFPTEYVISASVDGVNFEKCAEGVFRTFTGEEIVRFAPREARYVRLDVLSTTGSRLGREAYVNIPVNIAELSLFE